MLLSAAAILICKRRHLVSHAKVKAALTSFRLLPLTGTCRTRCRRRCCSGKRCGAQWQIVGLLGVVQMAHLADAVHPVAHAGLRLSCQIVDALWRLDIEHVLKLLLAVLQAQATVDLLALIQIDDTLQLAAVLIRVVFKAELLRYLALLQCEPASTPAL